MPKTTIEMSEADELPWTLTSLNCKRCPHLWFPRSQKKPKRCPKCGSPYWDRDIAYPTISQKQKKGRDKNGNLRLCRTICLDFYRAKGLGCDDRFDAYLDLF